MCGLSNQGLREGGRGKNNPGAHQDHTEKVNGRNAAVQATCRYYHNIKNNALTPTGFFANKLVFFFVEEGLANDGP